MHHTRSLLCTAQEEREDDDEDEQDNNRAIQLSSVDRREPTHKYNDNFAKCITLPGYRRMLSHGTRSLTGNNDRRTQPHTSAGRVEWAINHSPTPLIRPEVFRCLEVR